MKKSTLTPEQKKANKSAYDKAYRLRKKAEKSKIEITEFSAQDFSKSFDYPVRTYWNLRFEIENSSCAKSGTFLNFQYMHETQSGEFIYRIKRGKRHFYTKSNELVKPE